MHSRLVSPGLLNSSPRRSNFFINAWAALLVALIAAFTVSTLSAAAQATQTASTPPPELSRFDLYGGYGYLHPVGSDIGNVQYQPINRGAVVSAAGYFSRHVGVQAEGSFFPSGPNDCDDQSYYRGYHVTAPVFSLSVHLLVLPNSFRSLCRFTIRPHH